MSKDQYLQMRKELFSLWKILKNNSVRHLPESKEVVYRKLLDVNKIASEIGGQMLKDAEDLKGHIDRFLSGKVSEAQINHMFMNALKLEQDTREL